MRLRRPIPVSSPRRAEIQIVLVALPPVSAEPGRHLAHVATQEASEVLIIA